MVRERMWAEAESASLREEETVRPVEATASERPPGEMEAGRRGGVGGATHAEIPEFGGGKVRDPAH